MRKRIFKWGTAYGFIISLYIFYPDQIIKLVTLFGMGFLFGMDVATYLFIKYVIPRIKREKHDDD
jgi:adenine/guanine phosphoribosyltransferase-like PRPP-binding protein